MERDIVFAHELVEFDLRGVLPPLFPVGNVFGSDADVADGSIEPDIEHFISEPIQRHRSPPLQVTSDASTPQTLFDPSVGDGFGIVAPTPTYTLRVNKGF